MSGIITGLMCRVSDGSRVRTYLLTDAPYHDAALASQLEYGTALPVIPRDAGLSISEEISFQPQGGSSNTGISQIPLINAEGYFDDWGGWILSGLEQTMRRGYADQAWSDWTTLFDGRGRGKPEFIGRERVLLTIRDRFAYMAEPVATSVFGEDDVSNDRLINTTVPMVFGSAFQVDPLLTEPQILRYAVGENVNDVPRVQEGGNPATPVFEYVPLGFQLFASPTLEITCDVSGPAVAGWEEGDVLASIGSFETWDSGLPEGWDVSEDAPYAVISEDSSGFAQVENTAKIDGNTGWITATAWEAPTNENTGNSFEPVGTSSLVDALEADDGTYAEVESVFGSNSKHSMTGTGWSFGFPSAVEPVKVEAKITLEAEGSQDVALYKFFVRLADGTTRNLLPSGINYLPTTKDTWDLEIDPVVMFGVTTEALEDEDLEVYAQIFQGSTTGGYRQTVKIHEIALKVHYGTVVDRLRLTSEADVMTVGNRYLLRINTEGASDDSIRAFWGGVSSHSSDLPSSDNPYAQISAQMEADGTHEFSFISQGAKFAIEFDRGDGNGEQTIRKIELLDKTASRERYSELMQYIHETADKDPDEVCDVDSFDTVQTQAGNPRLGRYVSDQTTREQLAVLFSHSVGATCWGGIDGLYHAAQMRVPQQPDGEYLSIEGAFESGRATPDTGDDLRDRVHAAKNQKPLRESETAGVTTTWDEEQRQQVIAEWRITEKADWSNLVGYPTLTLTGIDPATGDIAGNTNVTLTGTGFEDGMTFTFDGEPGTNVVVVSSTEATVDTPEGPSGGGAVDVVATVGSNSVTLEDAFEYTGTAWSPADITSDVWVEADSEAPFEDMSGNESDFSAPSGFGTPSIVSDVLNGLPIMRFTGGELLESDAGIDIRNCHVFVVAKSTAGNLDDAFFIAHRTSGASDRLYIRRDGFWWGGASITFSADSQWRVWETKADGDSKEGWRTADSVGDTTDSSSQVHSQLYLGGGDIGSELVGLIGDVYALLAVPLSTPQADIDRIQGYYAHKCGLQGDLPSGHTYKSSPP